MDELDFVRKTLLGVFAIFTIVLFGVCFCFMLFVDWHYYIQTALSALSVIVSLNLLKGEK